MGKILDNPRACSSIAERRQALTDTMYAAWWAATGVVRIDKTLAFVRERKLAEELWRNTSVAKFTDLGTVDRLKILPLVDFYSASSELAGEPGVSYLVDADQYRILFDVGRNVKEEHPSPLLRNMARLGVTVDSLDAVFISHLHLDHVGGIGCQRERTFSLSAGQVDLQGLPAYVPEKMNHPTAKIIVADKPLAIAPGLASTGPIMRALWYMGPVFEHALLVHVKNKGLVVVIGCAHPTVQRIVERALSLVEAPLYAVVGGLHFPVTGSRVGKGGQNIIGNGKFPWQRITRHEAEQAADFLKTHGVKLVAVSAHDCCEWSLDLFARKLGDTYKVVKAGEEITI